MIKTVFATKNPDKHTKCVIRRCRGIKPPVTAPISVVQVNISDRSTETIRTDFGVLFNSSKAQCTDSPRDKVWLLRWS